MAQTCGGEKGKKKKKFKSAFHNAQYIYNGRSWIGAPLVQYNYDYNTAVDDT